MTTRCVMADDGVPIAYDVQGAGPALLLLHGFSGDRMIWSNNGWVERLQQTYTTITLDLRGCGESGKPADSDAYRVELHLADIAAVLRACGVIEYRVWGWSFGATIATLLTAHGPQPQCAVIAGTVFGRIFTEEYVQRQVSQVEPLARAQAEGRLDQLDLSEGARAFAARVNLAVYIACWRGMLSWPGVEPAQVRCPAVVYTGSEDGNVVQRLEQQRAAIEAAGLQMHVFGGLNHQQLLSERDTVAPVVEPFLVSAGSNA